MYLCQYRSLSTSSSNSVSFFLHGDPIKTHIVLKTVKQIYFSLKTGYVMPEFAFRSRWYFIIPDTNLEAIVLPVLIHDDIHVDGARLYLWTAATKWPISYPRGDIWAWESWWIGTYRTKLLIRSPELSGNPTSSHLVAYQEKLAKKIMTLALRIIFTHTSKEFLTCRKILRHWADGFTSGWKEGMLWILIAIKNSSPTVRF
jgi:hypothetical protein